MSNLKSYTIEFLAKRGCEQGIVLDMARFDSADMIEAELVDGQKWRAADFPGYPVPPGPESMFRKVTFKPRVPRCATPTIPRWSSFSVGARLVDPG